MKLSGRRIKGKSLRNIATDIAKRSKGIFSSSSRVGSSKRDMRFCELTDTSSCPYQEFDDEEVYDSHSASERNNVGAPSSTSTSHDDNGIISTDSSNVTNESAANKLAVPKLSAPKLATPKLAARNPTVPPPKPALGHQEEEDIDDERFPSEIRDDKDNDGNFGRQDDTFKNTKSDGLSGHRKSIVDIVRQDYMRDTLVPFQNDQTSSDESSFPDVREKVDALKPYRKEQRSEHQRPEAFLDSSDEEFVPVHEKVRVDGIDEGSDTPPAGNHFGSSDISYSDGSNTDGEKEVSSITSGFVRTRVRNFSPTQGKRAVEGSGPIGGVTRNALAVMLSSPP